MDNQPQTFDPNDLIDPGDNSWNPIKEPNQIATFNPAGPGDVFSSAFHAASLTALDVSRQIGISDALKNRLATVKALTGQTIPNPEDVGDSLSDPYETPRPIDLLGPQTRTPGSVFPPSYYGIAGRNGAYDETQGQLDAVAAAHPGDAVLSQINRPLMPDVYANANAALQKQSDDYTNSGGGALNYAASVAGGLAAQARDPLQWFSMVAAPEFKIGGGVIGQIFSHAVSNAAVSGGLTALTGPTTRKFMADAGDPDSNSLLGEVGESALFGAGAGAFLGSIHPTLKWIGKGLHGEATAAEAAAHAPEGLRPVVDQGIQATLADREAAPPPPPGIAPEDLPPLANSAVRMVESEAQPLPIPAADHEAENLLIAANKAAESDDFNDTLPDWGLDPAAQERVLNGEVAPQYGEMTARMEANPVNHAPIIDALADAAPQNASQAQTVISDEMHAIHVGDEVRSVLGIEGGDPVPGVLSGGEADTRAAVYGAHDDMGQLGSGPVPGFEQELADGSSPNGPSGPFLFPAEHLGVDAARFQFKSDGDAQGVTSALKGVTKWDISKQNSLIVWQDLQNRLWAADGHQRMGLARRLMQQGHEPINLSGVLYREAQGVTAADARALAAAKNIAEGSGSPIDIAKVLRDRPELLDGTMPLTRTAARMGSDLARLSPEAFGMVANETVPYQHAAIVGDMMRGKDEMHAAALRAIAKFRPADQSETRALVARMAQSELLKHNAGAQGSFFENGDDSSVVAEMRLTAAAAKMLNHDRALFSRVISGADRLETAGSHIARSEAEKVVADAGVAAQHISSAAYYAGPVKDALRAAAKEFHDGKITLATGARRIIDAVKEAAQDDIHARGDAGANGREAAIGAADARAEGQPGDVEPGADDAGLFGRAVREEAIGAADARAEGQPGDVEPGAEGRTLFERQALEGGAKEPGAEGQTLFEPGAEGLPQGLIPGVKPVTDADRIALRAAAPLQGGDAAPGGLFDDNSRAQMDMLDAAANVPIDNPKVPLPEGYNNEMAQTVPLMADGQVQMVPRAELRASLDAEPRENYLADLIKNCIL